MTPIISTIELEQEKKQQLEMMSALNHKQTINDFFHNIPDEILAEILKTLPVKSLLRCLCIQKSWYHLIKTSDFIKLHLNYHQKNTTTTSHTNDLPKYLLCRSYTDVNLLFLSYDDEHCKELLKDQLPSVIRLGDCACWQATSCGLICVSSIFNVYGYEDTRTYVWNPLIQKFRTLPLLDLSHISENHWMALAFGYVPSINDFQVVQIVSYSSNESPSFLICKYSLNRNSWTTKTIREDISVGLSNQLESVSVDGISCWRAFSNKETVETDTLLCFDTSNDMLRTIPLPQVGNRIDSLHQFGQSVALFVHHKSNVFNMWILKQDSANDFSWEKKVSVSLWGRLANAVILGSRNNGEVILSTFYESDLVSYNPETREAKNFSNSWKNWTELGSYDLYYKTPPLIVHPFVAGLVLLDTD